MNPESFFQAQLAGWPLARDNYARLHRVRYKAVAFPGYEIRIQCNPDRIQSAAARIDPASLRQRACFLCRENMPPEQGSLSYNDRFDIRVNPYPIFARHFTVPARCHTDQLIGGYFEDMVDLAADFPDYSVFYNGPRSGASAPDHLHFQLAPREEIPLVGDIRRLTPAGLSSSGTPPGTTAPPGDLRVETLPGYIRKNIILRSTGRQRLIRGFYALMERLGSLAGAEPEPMINLFVWRRHEEWYVVLFLRSRHRPWQFFAEGAGQVLFSPGCIDFAGLVIAPRPVDFERYDAPLLRDLFEQLTWGTPLWEQLVESLHTHPL